MSVDERSGVLRSRVPCIGCGYDLRGLRRDSSCPECGTSIEKTLSTVPTPGLKTTRWFFAGTLASFLALSLIGMARSSNVPVARPWLDSVTTGSLMLLLLSVIGSMVHFWLYPTIATLLCMLICMGLGVALMFLGFL